MTKKEYNGWYNYETWAVKLWMDEDSEYFTENAQAIYDAAKPSRSFTKLEQATLDLAESYKQHHEESVEHTLNGMQSGFIVDLLNAAMSEINWHEIAASILEGIEQEEQEANSSDDVAYTKAE